MSEVEVVLEAVGKDRAVECGSAFADVVKARYSVRGFRPDPVPAAVLREVFALAARAPSNCNTQPWQVYVVSGAKLQKLRETLPAAMMSGDISMDFPYEGKYAGVYKERQYDAAAQLYSAMGIERDDKARRGAAFMRNFEFFGAPHAAFIFLPEPFGLREAADCGMYAQTLMLALTARGIGSCPQTALSFHADILRRELGIDASQKLLFGISFGYADPDEPANNCRIARDVDAVTHFVD